MSSLAGGGLNDPTDIASGKTPAAKGAEFLVTTLVTFLRFSLKQSCAPSRSAFPPDSLNAGIFRCLFPDIT